jgi:hypothetical protein
MVQSLWRLSVVHKLKIVQSHNSSITLWDMCLIEMKSYYYKATCIKMFTAALYIILKPWNKQCSLIESIN